jgi:hypothetical protein
MARACRRRVLSTVRRDLDDPNSCGLVIDQEPLARCNARRLIDVLRWPAEQLSRKARAQIVQTTLSECFRLIYVSLQSSTVLIAAFLSED